MERRKFLKLSGLASFGLLSTSFTLTKEDDVMYSVKNIGEPRMHSIHGYMPETSNNSNISFKIEREIYQKVGLNNEKEAKISVLNLEWNSQSISEILMDSEIRNGLKIITINRNTDIVLKVKPNSYIIPEFEDIQINNQIINKNECILVNSQGKLTFKSDANQKLIMVDPSILFD